MIYSLQYGKRPLYVAAKKGHTNVVDMLLTHGAYTGDKWVRNLNRYMCLHTCVQSG